MTAAVPSGTDDRQASLANRAGLAFMRLLAGLPLPWVRAAGWAEPAAFRAAFAAYGLACAAAYAWFLRRRA